MLAKTRYAPGTPAGEPVSGPIEQDDRDMVAHEDVEVGRRGGRRGHDHEAQLFRDAIQRMGGAIEG